MILLLGLALAASSPQDDAQFRALVKSWQDADRPAQTDAIQQIDGIPLDWIARLSGSLGFDVTPDGRVWLNADPHGVGSDFSISARELYNSTGPKRTVWVRGDHSHDATVKYRKSMHRMTFDCPNDLYQTLSWTMYSANGHVVASGSPYFPPFEPIIPESQAASWQRIICSAAVPHY